MATSRLLPILTLIPTIFTFIAIILINVGGINSYSQPRNTAFRLVSWNYTLTPVQSYTSYANTVYLSRLCYSQAVRPGSSTSLVPYYEQCPKAPHGRTIRDDSLRSVRNVRPFRFDRVVLNAPFAMYILAALCVVAAMLVAVVPICASTSRGVGKGRKGFQLLGMVVSVLTLLFLLIASAVITYQANHLFNQILHNSRLSFRTVTGGRVNTTTVRINSVTLGTTVLGLTWGAVAAMLISCAMWTVAWLDVRRESTMDVMRDGIKEEQPPRYELQGKESRHVEGGL